MGGDGRPPHWNLAYRRIYFNRLGAPRPHLSVWLQAVVLWHTFPSASSKAASERCPSERSRIRIRHDGDCERHCHEICRTQQAWSKPLPNVVWQVNLDTRLIRPKRQNYQRRDHQVTAQRRSYDNVGHSTSVCHVNVQNIIDCSLCLPLFDTLPRCSKDAGSSHMS